MGFSSEALNKENRCQWTEPNTFIMGMSAAQWRLFFLAGLYEKKHQKINKNPPKILKENDAQTHRYRVKKTADCLQTG